MCHASERFPTAWEEKAGVVANRERGETVAKATTLPQGSMGREKKREEATCFAQKKLIKATTVA